jgi:Ca-activated chloride channel family protein
MKMPTIGSPVLEKTGTGLVTVDGRTFPLQATRVRGRAAGGLAATRLVQEYDNPYTSPLEVIYTLPLPADGAVVAYTIRLGDKVITGHVEPRETAREQYRQALEEGRTAGLLEQERADTFTLTLGSLPPGVAAHVEVEVMHPLGLCAGDGDEGPRWEYRFPTVVGVRYQGEPGRVADAEKLEVTRADENGTPVRLDLDLVLADGPSSLLSPRSSSHTLDRRDEDGATRMILADNADLDRDIVVHWRASRPSVGLSLVEGPGMGDDDGRYGLLTVTPPAVPDATFARDLTILIDASGSMSGEPLEQAKRVVEELLGSLGSEDRFELRAFASRDLPLTDGLVPARAAELKKAVKQLHALRAGGGTEMTKAVLRALKPLRAESQRQVVLLTDGYVGFEQEVISQILKSLPAGARLHVVGVSSAPNRTLTRGASRAGGGVELIVAPGGDALDAAKRLRRHTTAPVLTEIAVRGSAVEHVAPERPCDVLAGLPARLALRLRAEGGTIEVRGALAGRSEPWIERIKIGPRASTEQESEGDEAAALVPLPLGAFYGRERVEDCEMELAAVGHGPRQDSILDEIESLGVRHQIVTRRTSFVAISEDVTVDPRDPRRRQRLAVELPADVSAEGVGLAGAGGIPMMSAPQTLGVAGMTVADFRESLQRHALSVKGVDFDELYQGEMQEVREEPPDIEGRIVRQESDLLVVEFEVPARGLELPGTDASFRIRFENGVMVKGRLDDSLSTKPGRHEPGLTVRLAVRIAHAAAARSKPVVLVWSIDTMKGLLGWFTGHEVVRLAATVARRDRS